MLHVKSKVWLVFAVPKPDGMGSRSISLTYCFIICNFHVALLRYNHKSHSLKCAIQVFLLVYSQDSVTITIISFQNIS